MLYTKADVHAVEPIYCSADVHSLYLQSFEAPINWWTGLRKTTARPTRDDVGFSELAGLHDRVVLYRINDDRTDMEMRIVGELAQEIFRGEAQKGTMFRSLIETDDQSQQDHLRRIVDDFNICINFGVLRTSDHHDLKITAIDFPLAPGKSDPMAHMISFFTLRPLERFWG